MHPSAPACPSKPWRSGVRSGKPPAGFPQDVLSLLPSPDTVSDDLQELPAECYDDAIEAILRVLAPHPGVLCVARFGTVNLPGVSDIDLFVICCDESYAELRRICDQAILQTPLGSSLFVHQIMILPHSLLPLRRILFIPDHPFDRFHVLWGDPSLLEGQLPPPFPLTVINTVIWHSALWRSILATSRDRRGARRLLLLLRLITMHTALDYRFLGDHGRFHSVQSWGKELRRSCLLASPPRRAGCIRDALRCAITSFVDAEWEFHRWWREEVWREQTTSEWQLSLEGQDILFAEDPYWGKLADSVISPLILPSLYTDVMRALAHAFAGLSPLLPPSPTCIPSFLSPEWREATISYERAVLVAREFSERVSGDPFFIFTGERKRGIFPTPFAL